MRYIFFIFLFMLYSCKPTIYSIYIPRIDDGVIKFQILPDYDKDGIPDKYDKCPYVSGGINNMGCPSTKQDSLKIDYSDVVEKIVYYGTKDSSSKKPVTWDYEGYENRIKKNKEVKKVLVTKDIKEIRPKGLIAYSVPNEMEVGSEYSVKVRITKQNDKTVLLIGDREIPISDDIQSVKIESITISPVMSASLLSQKGNFEITPLSTDIQNIDEIGYTEWSWAVTPLHGGENNLKLNVKIRIKEDGNDYYKDITVFERKIKVKSSIGSVIKDFIFKNWQWFMGVIFIPLFQWFWLLFKRKREEKEKDV